VRWLAPYQLFIADRYLRSRRGHWIIVLVSAIAIVGVAVGVAAQVIGLAIANGFEREVKTRITGTNAHVILLKYGNESIVPDERLMRMVRETPHVVGASPFVFGKVMILAGKETEGAVLKGIDVTTEREVTSVLESVKPKKWEDLLLRGATPGVLLGKEMATRLNVAPGDPITIASFEDTRIRATGIIPRLRNFHVAGTFEAGMYEFDSTLGLVTLDAARDLFGMKEGVTGVAIRLDDMYLAPQLGDRLAERLGNPPYRANDWIDLNRHLFKWIRIEKIMMLIALGLIVLVGAFIIASTLIMRVLERTREIGILKSIGVDRAGVMGIFVVEGMFIGLFGTLLGLALGLTASFLLDRYPLHLPGDVYFIETLPVEVDAPYVIAVVVLALAISFLATLVPSFLASRLDPVRAIRYE
jgi:lipoprotein-releasing system permease protein